MSNFSSQSRRRFIKNAALFSAGLATPLLRIPFARTQETQMVDAVVIGSGFGGAVAALRLSEAGINTVVLEKGRRWPVNNPQANETFSTFRAPDRRSGWLRFNSPVVGFGFGDAVDNLTINPPYVGMFEGFDNLDLLDFLGFPDPRVNLEKVNIRGVSILTGAGVGGGSLVYNTILYQPNEQNFRRIFPQGIDYNEMAQLYYPRVLATIPNGPTPQDILNTNWYRATRVLLEQGEAAGYRSFLVNLGIEWDKVRDEINGTRVPSAIIGETWHGLNSDAKASVDKNYLAMAEALGTTILPQHMVMDIADNPGGGFQVIVNQIDDNGNTVATKTFISRLVFLGAGSVGSSAILVRAKGKNTLANLSANDFIGAGWAGNGDHLALMFGLPSTSNSNNDGQGGPAGTVIQDFPFVEEFDGVSLAPGHQGTPVLTRPNPRYNGINPISLMNLAQWTNNNGLLGLGIGLPTATVPFTYNPADDSVNLRLPDNANSAFVKAMYRMTARLNLRNSAVGRRPGSTVAAPSTAHPLGGAVMGMACDLDGRVLGYQGQGLYVVDGALIPGSTAACNPALTIAATAERSMEKIRQSGEWSALLGRPI